MLTKLSSISLFLNSGDNESEVIDGHGGQFMSFWTWNDPGWMIWEQRKELMISCEEKEMEKENEDLLHRTKGFKTQRSIYVKCLTGQPLRMIQKGGRYPEWRETLSEFISVIEKEG